MRARRSILNFGTSALLMAVTMAVSLPATPWLIRWLEASVYGGVKVVNEAFGWITILELGLGGAIGPLLAGALGRGDERAVRETVAAGSRAYLWVVVVCVCVGLAATPIVPWFARGLTPPQVVDLRRAWVVQLAAFLPLVFLPLRSVFDARQLGYVVNLLLIGQSLVITGTSLLLAYKGWGITGQAVAQVLGAWSFGLVLAAGAFRTHPGLFRAMLTMPTTPETRRALRNLSAPTLLLNVCGRVSVLSDRMVLGALRNTSLVTSLDNTQKLAVMGQSVLQAVGGASWAALAELHAQGRIETFNRRLVEMTRVVTVLAVIGLVPVVAYNRAFIRIWLRGESFYGGDAVTTLAAVNAVLLATQSLWGWCFAATGKVRDVIPIVTAAAFVNIGTSVVMTRIFGMPGPLIGSTVAFVGVGLWATPRLLHRTFGTPVVELAKAVGVPFAVGALAAGALRGFTQYHEPNGWAGLAAEMSLAALAMLAVSVTLLLTPEDRAHWRQRLSSLRPGMTP